MAAPDPVIAIVVAMDEDGIIGREGTLPWRLSSDLKQFRKLTMGKPLIMGRLTFASIGRPLDGRDNIVLSRDRSFAHPGVQVAHAPDAALDIARQCAQARGADEVMIIGGAEIYRLLLPRTKRIYLTRVHAHVGGDTHFPPLSASDWKETSRVTHRAGPKDDHDYSFTVLERVY